MLGDFAGCRAECGYKGSLKEIYVPITFQEPSSMMSYPILVAQIKLSLPET